MDLKKLAKAFLNHRFDIDLMAFQTEFMVLKLDYLIYGIISRYVLWFYLLYLPYSKQNSIILNCK